MCSTPAASMSFIETVEKIKTTEQCFDTLTHHSSNTISAQTPPT